MDFNKLTDRELIVWAITYGGWMYFNSNDQLKDLQGGMTSTHDWENLGIGRRKQILLQMKKSCNIEQYDVLLRGDKMWNFKKSLEHYFKYEYFNIKEVMTVDNLGRPIEAYANKLEFEGECIYWKSFGDHGEPRNIFWAFNKSL